MNDLWVVLNPSDVAQSVEWDRELTTVRAGETRILPEYLADHFASHVSYRMLRAEGRPYDEFRRAELLSEIKVRRAADSDAPYPDSSHTDTLERKERYVEMKEAALAVTLRKAEEQSAKLEELIGSYERRFASLKSAEKAVKVRELALDDARK